MFTLYRQGRVGGGGNLVSSTKNGRVDWQFHKLQLWRPKESDGEQTVSRARTRYHHFHIIGFCAFQIIS